MLEKVTALLEVEPLKFRVPVFLFPNVELLNRFAGNQERAKQNTSQNSGYAHDNAISLAYCKSGELATTAAHEFTHVLCYQRVSRKLMGLLDEGLACYVEHTLYATRDRYPRLPVSWRMMARYTVFYEWIYANQPPFASWKYYAYAYSVAAYLIHNFDLQKYLELCRKVTSDKEYLAGEKFAQAIQEVYGQPVTELEAAWRKANGEQQPEELLKSHADLEQQLDRARTRIGELTLENWAMQDRLSGQQRLDFDSDGNQDDP